MALTARVPAGVGAAGFVQEYWSKKVLDAIHNFLVALPLVDHSWEPELKLGDTVNIGILNTVVAAEVVVGQAGSALDIATGTKKQIVVNQWWEAPVVLDDMTNLQSQVNLVEKAQKEGGYAIAKKIDSTLCALFSPLNGASVLGTDGGAIIDDVLIEAMETLDEADVPEDNRCLILDPSAKADLLKIDKFIRTDYVREAVVPTGKFGNLYNMGIYITNNLTAVTNGTGNYGCMLHKEAIAAIVQMNSKVDRWVEPLKHQQTINTHALWGVKEMRNTFGIPIYTRKA